MSFQFEVTARMGIKRTSNRFNLGVALRTRELKTTNLTICFTFLTRHFAH
jgi:hypothetical protein